MRFTSVAGGLGWGEVLSILARADNRNFGSGCGPTPAIVDTLSTPALNAGLETVKKIVLKHILAKLNCFFCPFFICTYNQGYPEDWKTQHWV